MILVTGSTGNVGRELVRELAARDTPFRVLVRDRTRAVQPPDHAERVVADLDDPSTLPAAFAGADTLFLLTPGIGLAHTAHAVAAASAAGVGRIVHLSSFNVLGDPMPAMGRWHHDREEAIRATGIPATFLRPGGFMTNALDWLPTLREGRYVLDPAGPGRYAPVDPADIAAVAALALTEDGHEGAEYVLTGAETFTVAEQAAVIADTVGVPLTVRDVATAEEAVRSRFPNGAPPALAAALAEGFALMRADTVGLRTDTVEKLLGRAPGTFAAWCARHADVFRAAVTDARP
ncbi:SDR family oxidoreductase [Yinghuangia seranimata]|uniref:SDR family oxidoreductase n=1 Tax=Yinghuangia seranimata TaxID=408067 RepID=UPI00248BA55B|nr:NAD(P)H-binding protein [Yinghuangia seranimata]MDI2131098.1 NAD(P)H-binding protein [Yinghuangia seranimata]